MKTGPKVTAEKDDHAACVIRMLFGFIDISSCINSNLRTKAVQTLYRLGPALYYGAGYVILIIFFLEMHASGAVPFINGGCGSETADIINTVDPWDMTI